MFDPSTAQGQLQIQRSEDAKILAVCRVYNEIMTGPNPLTHEEVARLIQKRPHIYGCLGNCAIPREELMLRFAAAYPQGEDPE